MAKFTSKFYQIIVICGAILVHLAQAAGTGITFCNENHFDSMFQDNEYVYLNVYDENNKENRLYRFVPGSSEIDQFVTIDVDSGESSSTIPLSHFK